MRDSASKYGRMISVTFTLFGLVSSSYADTLYSSVDLSTQTAVNVIHGSNNGKAGLGDDYDTGYASLTLTGLSFFGGLSDTRDNLIIDFYNTSGVKVKSLYPNGSNLMGVGMHSLLAGDFTQNDVNGVTIPGKGYVLFKPYSYTTVYINENGNPTEIPGNPDPTLSLGFGGAPTLGGNDSTITAMTNTSGAFSTGAFATGTISQVAEFSFSGTGNGAPAASEWTSASDGVWTLNANWTPSSPNGLNTTANFKNFESSINGPVTVSVDAAKTVGTISFENANKYTISGSAAITINSTTAGAINVVSGSHDITAPVVLAKNTTVTVTESLSTLKFTALQSTGVNFTKAGAGTLEVNHLLTTGSLTIESGRVAVTANGGSAGVSSVKSVTIAPLNLAYAGKLELHDNDLVIDYTGNATAYATTVAQVKSGLALLGGDGTGIGSTEIDSQTLPGTMLAVVDGGSIGGLVATLSGYILPNPSSSVLVKYTWRGDANLDGVVNGSDYALADTGFSGGGSGWFYGDMNYDGVINGSDYALIDTGFSSQTGPLPEPSVLSLLGIGAMGILRRRRWA